MSELVKVLMQRDEISQDEAENIVNGLRRRMFDGEDPEEMLRDELGLEPDYIMDLF